MPIYDAKCKSCGHQFEYVSSMANRDDVPDCELCKSSNVIREVVKAPSLGCAWSMGLVKPDADFRNMLTHIAKKNPGSNVNDRS